MPDFATELADKIKRETERLPQDTDLMALATEMLTDLFKTTGDLEQMVFYAVTKNHDMFTLANPTPTPEYRAHTYNLVRRIFTLLDVVAYAYAVEAWYSKQRVTGQLSKDPHRKEALFVSVVTKDPPTRCSQADIMRDAKGKPTLLPWKRALTGPGGPAVELLEPEPHLTRQ